MGSIGSEEPISFYKKVLEVIRRYLHMPKRTKIKTGSFIWYTQQIFIHINLALVNFLGSAKKFTIARCLLSIM